MSGERDPVGVEAARLLAEGRVSLLLVQPRVVEADVEGDTGLHRVEWNDVFGWSCECPAFMFKHHCSHREAIQRVVSLAPRDDLAPPEQQDAEALG